MPIAKQSGEDFTPLPTGSHVARCIACISLGTQQSPMFPARFKIMLMFEVPGETVTIDGKPAPMTIQKEYTLSLSEKANLRHDVESWRGREFTPTELDGFDVGNVVGAPGMLSVIHKTSANKKVYANIASIVGLPRGVSCPPIWHKAIKYEIEAGEDATFKSFPQWIQKKIQACDEWTHPTGDQGESQAEAPQGEAPEGADQDIPF